MPRRDFDPQLDRMEREEARWVKADEEGTLDELLAADAAEAEAEAQATADFLDDERALQALWDSEPAGREDGPTFDREGWQR